MFYYFKKIKKYRKVPPLNYLLCMYLSCHPRACLQVRSARGGPEGGSARGTDRTRRRGKMSRGTNDGVILQTCRHLQLFKLFFLVNGKRYFFMLYRGNLTGGR